MVKRARYWKAVVVLLTVSVLILAASSPSQADSLSQLAQWYAAQYGTNGPVIITGGTPVTTVPTPAPSGKNTGTTTGSSPGTTTGGQTTTATNPAPVTLNSNQSNLLQYYLTNYAGGAPGTIIFSPPTTSATTTGTTGTTGTTTATGNTGSTSTPLPSGSNIWSGYSASYSLNADEQQLLGLVNQQRVANNLPAFKLNLKLSYLARLRAQEMAGTQTLTHYLPVYGTPPQMEETAGIYANPFGAENICEGPSVAVDNNALFNSAPHRANLLDPQETQIGLGVVRSSNGIVWVSELFLGN